MVERTSTAWYTQQLTNTRAQQWQEKHPGYTYAEWLAQTHANNALAKRMGERRHRRAVLRGLLEEQAVGRG